MSRYSYPFRIIFLASDGSNNNIISNNNYVNNTIQFSANEDYYLTFGHNRSVNTINENYWSDYLTKYPDANEIDNSGIWDTPYAIDSYNIDNYPLMNTFIVMPSPEPQPEPFPTVPVVAFLASVILVGVGLLLFFKKRKSEAKTS